MGDETRQPPKPEAGPERSDPSRDPARARAPKKSPKKKGRTNIRPRKAHEVSGAKPLSPKRLAFVEAYMETSNGTESARRAGYTGTPEALAVTASRLLRDAKVAAAIAERQREPKARGEASRRELRQFWTGVMRGEVVTEIRKVDDAGNETVTKVPSEMRDRLKASEHLAKTRGMFIEKREHKHEGAVLNELSAALQRALNESGEQAPQPNGVKSD